MANRKKYDWDKLFKRKTFKLRQGKDYDCKPMSINVYVREEARKRGLSVNINNLDNGDLIVTKVSQ